MKRPQKSARPYPPAKNPPKQGPVKPDPISEKSFNSACKALGMELSSQEAATLRAYMDMLMLWNTRINLVGTLDWKETLNTLIIDSFHLAKYMNTLPLPENPLCLDLGAGAGLPGIPLRILWQKGHYSLIESREKRALFMTNFLLKNPLPQTTVFWQRAEVFFSKQAQNNQQAHCILSRAFMPYEELVDFVTPHLHSQGFVLLLQNNIITPPAGWKIHSTFPYSVENQTRYFIALHR